MIHLTDEPCECPDALAFRALLASPAGQAADALASTLAVWKLRSMAWDLSTASDWSRPIYPYVDGDRYSTAGRTAEEIRRDTAASWAEFEQGHGPVADLRKRPA